MKYLFKYLFWAAISFGGLPRLTEQAARLTNQGRIEPWLAVIVVVTTQAILLTVFVTMLDHDVDRWLCSRALRKANKNGGRN